MYRVSTALEFTIIELFVVRTNLPPEQVICPDYATGKLAAPYCVSWNQGNTGDNPTCGSTSAIRPGTTTDCACDDDFKMLYCPTVGGCTRVMVYTNECYTI